MTLDTSYCLFLNILFILAFDFNRWMIKIRLRFGERKRVFCKGLIELDCANRIFILALTINLTSEIFLRHNFSYLCRSLSHFNSNLFIFKFKFNLMSWFLKGNEIVRTVNEFLWLSSESSSWQLNTSPHIWPNNWTFFLSWTFLFNPWGF
jgi:hypothetical protein